MSLKIHVLQHVPFEGPAAIIDWAKENNYAVNYTYLYKPDFDFPTLENIDLLVIMGGPMGVYDTDTYSWIEQEQSFIKACIENNKAIIGICLGAQFLAKALNARVYSSGKQEIGWFPIYFNNNNLPAELNDFPDKQTVFHWHGDTFDLPAGAKLFASSEAFPNQGFIYKDRIIGLQFHLEVTKESVQKMLQNVAISESNSDWVQQTDFIQKNDHFISANIVLLRQTLSYLSGRIN